MTAWTAGYVTEIDYTHGYYRELCPTLLRYVLLHRGLSALPARRPRYLELGFGQALSLAIHAAASPGEYWGTDFNPAHAATARELLAAAGVPAYAGDQSFAELAASDLPEFDIIALHGIWSWISDENRAVIVDLVRRKLAVGGVLYISYNCTPGWSPAIPLRHLMKTHADLAGSGEQGMAQRIEQALDFTQRVIDSNARYFVENPNQTVRLKAMRGMDRNYLAHEYFNRDWQPMPFSEVAERLAEAKVDFAASVNLLDHVDAINLSPDMQTLLAGVNHPVLRETVRDYMVNQQFRKDLFVKGRRLLATGEQVETMLRQRFVLSIPAEDVPMKLNAGQGEITLQEPVYRPLLWMLSEDGNRAKSIGELLANPAWEGKPLGTLAQALVVLVGAGFAFPAQDDEAIAAARPACAALNRHLRQLAHHRGIASHLASPVIGGGVAVNRFQQMFLTAREAGHATAREWAQAVWDILLGQNQRILKDGKPIESAEDNLAELIRQAEAFAGKYLGLLEVLGVV